MTQRAEARPEPFTSDTNLASDASKVLIRQREIPKAARKLAAMFDEYAPRETIAAALVEVTKDVKGLPPEVGEALRDFNLLGGGK